MAVLLTVACSGPKIVPDRELAQIFHDIYLVNTYVGQSTLNIDSLNIYEPVFASYGYTSEDIQYTIGNFAKRKSARLSDDVVEVASNMLFAESRQWSHRVKIRDTIALIAKEKFAEQVYADSLIRVRRVADTSRLRIVIPDIRPGSYEVTYGYLVDSLDRNPPIRVDAWLEDVDGRRSGSAQRRLDRQRHETVSATLTATEKDRRLVLALNGYAKDMSTPNLTIDSLTVMYYLPEEDAVRRLSRSLYGPSGSLDSLLFPPETFSEIHEASQFTPDTHSERVGVR